MADRVQKVLAAAGHGSRREIERWIVDGRLTIDGARAEPGAKIDGHERVCLDGKALSIRAPAKASHQHLMYNKPPGQVSSRRDEKDRDVVFDALPRPRAGRWIMVGRLDINTSGLLLFTTDGELAHRLMHPSSEVVRRYLVRVHGHLNDSQLRQLIEGVELDDGPARFTTLKATGGRGSNRWYQVTLKEGRNREIRRLFEAVGAEVNRLKRIGFATVALNRDLAPGDWRFLNTRETRTLLASINHTAK